MVGLHATDPASMVLAARGAECEQPLEELERALYVERSAVRILGMRRTVFVEPVDLVPVVLAACARALVPGERRRLVQDDRGGRGRQARCRLAAAGGAAALAALEARGEATAAELAEDVAALRVRITLARGKSYEGTQSVGSRVLFLLAAEGRIVRGRPLGSWSEHALPLGADRGMARRGPEELSARGRARRAGAGVAGAYGPGTFTDMKWWTGWTAAQLGEALADAAVRSR